ncbi:hypothetical protein PAXRUDRAFT_132087, partial [Paxillus rubicundulus Ve08.2h10]
WMEQNEKAHAIIQDSITAAILAYTTAWDLFDALLSTHQAFNFTSAFYTFQQLFNSAWSRASTVSAHIPLNS